MGHAQKAQARRWEVQESVGGQNAAEGARRAPGGVKLHRTEPGPVVTLNLTELSDLEPVWTLISDTAKTQNATRNLTRPPHPTFLAFPPGAALGQALGWRATFWAIVLFRDDAGIEAPSCMLG
jgi:hypothetical protein